MDYYIDKEFALKTIKERPKDIHKGQCGHTLVIGGSKGMVGAAILTAKGAYRSGAGLVKVSIDEEYFPIVQTALAEAICIDRNLPSHELEKYDAIALGPGMGLDSKNKALVERVLETKKPTVIIDADGLNFIKFIKRRQTDKLIITPHPGEAAKLLDLTAEEVNKDRRKSSFDLSKNYGAIAILKGFETVITDVSGKRYINTSGNPGMATGGSGDVLTGIIAGFVSQRYTPLESSLLATYIHGAAGDLGGELLGEHGLVASDIASMTGLVIKNILMKKKEMENE